MWRSRPNARQGRPNPACLRHMIFHASLMGRGIPLDWFDGQLDLDPEKLIFIDETGLSTKMARLRGRALRGERCRAGVPHGHWKTTTFTGALRLTGMTAPFVYDGAMNGNVFLAYVEQRSEEHTSELQSLMRISYAVF